ncbi:flagellar basal-body rod protein FlgG [Desulfofundulus kuznetsovii DSM 6115]|uniref:Flagellar basal-body rod protein FlgG n=1 Tax=Desulfofundulus kuznetsovii (strain DSM 6115 / VKM B-1805 / 17) TaxID=760568 RepID=A0AAU8P9U6_DESK7|nr:flagellar basal-body rod protein FlgG [Desulfofundulus kuznetsovii DSM 6115]
MLRALSTGAAGLTAQQIRLDTCANNLANINTQAYKKQGVSFADLLYQEMGREGIPAERQTAPGANTPGPTPPEGGGVRAAAISRDFRPGSLIRTGRPLDVAIQGKGFFRVQLPGGEYAYTRNGRFTVSSDGRLITEQGYPLEPEIILPPEYQSVTLHSDGRVTIINNDRQEEAGRLTLYSFPNPAGLAARGDSLYLATAASGEPDEDYPGSSVTGTLIQGCLEASNVALTIELTSLIEAQRVYQLNLRVVSSADEIWSMANNLRK